MKRLQTNRLPARPWAVPIATAALCGLTLIGGTGCQSAAARVAPLSLSESAVRLDLPLVRQDDLYDCGLASLSALCQYWGTAIPQEDLEALARTASDRDGLSGSELCGALERLGFEAYLFQGSLDRTPTGLYGHVDAGRPPLVMLAYGEGKHHYALVHGYDAPRGNLILLDPTKGEVLVPVDAFDRKWTRCQRFTLLACLKQTTVAQQHFEAVRETRIVDSTVLSSDYLPHKDN